MRTAGRRAITSAKCAFIAGAAAALLSACATSRSLDQSFSDIGADARLKQVLLADRSHNYDDVDLTVFEGRLLLTGTMASESGRRRLIENAWKAGGVEQVIDEVIIGDRTSLGQGLTDTRIDTAIRAKFVADGSVKGGRIKIAVSDGVVYLLGVTRDRTELEDALRYARTTGGVKKVVSHILYRDDGDIGAPAGEL